MASLASRRHCPPGLGRVEHKSRLPSALQALFDPRCGCVHFLAPSHAERASRGASRRCRRSSLAPAQTARRQPVPPFSLPRPSPMLHCPCQTTDGDALHRSPFLLDLLNPTHRAGMPRCLRLLQRGRNVRVLWPRDDASGQRIQHRRGDLRQVQGPTLLFVSHAIQGTHGCALMARVACITRC